MRAAILVAILTFAGAASAADTRTTRQVDAFTAVVVAAPITVYFTQGDAESLALEGDPSALAQLDTVVENGRLKLEQRTRERVPLMSKVKAYVTGRDIRRLSISGAGDIVVNSPLRTGDLKLAIAGSGDIHIAQLTAAKVDIDIGGSGDITVAGKADSVASSIAGSGGLRAGRLEVGEARVSIAGSGDATLWPRAKLSASIIGSGDVRYYGDPAVRTSIVGSGDVRRMGAAPS